MGRRAAFQLRVRSGLILRQNEFVVVPPIRFTPIEMQQVAEEYLLWKSDLQPGEVVIQVGCGMGTELVSLYKLVRDSGKIYAFEAHPRSFEIATAMKHLNDIRCAELAQIAIWNDETTLWISDHPDSLGINSLVDEGLLAMGKICVPARTLDSFGNVMSHTEIAALIVNVEGAEVSVLEGASEILERTRSAVVACHDFLAEAGSSPTLSTRSAVEQILTQAGFRVEYREHPNPAIRDTIYARR